MSYPSRRNLVLGTATVIALSITGGPLAPPAAGGPEKPDLDFREAQQIAYASIDQGFAISEKELGIKYTKEEADGIRNRLWDSTLEMLNSYYTVK